MKTITTKTITSEHGTLKVSVNVRDGELLPCISLLDERFGHSYFDCINLDSLILCLQEIKEAVNKEGIASDGR